MELRSLLAQLEVQMAAPMSPARGDAWMCRGRKTIEEERQHRSSRLSSIVTPLHTILPATFPNTPRTTPPVTLPPALPITLSATLALLCLLLVLVSLLISQHFNTLHVSFYFKSVVWARKLADDIRTCVFQQ